MIHAICRKDHTETGGAPAGALVAKFEHMQTASDRDIEETYPNCLIEYIEVDDNEGAHQHG